MHFEIVTWTAAFGYSASGFRLRGLLRLQMGKGLFGFSLVGVVGLTDGELRMNGG